MENILLVVLSSGQKTPVNLSFPLRHHLPFILFSVGSSDVNDQLILMLYNWDMYLILLHSFLT